MLIPVCFQNLFFASSAVSKPLPDWKRGHAAAWMPGALVLFATAALAQGVNPCLQPVSISSITIGNTTCGNKTGFIIVQVAGNTSAFTYQWAPNISTNSAAFDLASGAYQLRIVRNSEPNCVLDTTILVNNTNGPAFEPDTLLEPNCKAADGRLELSPATGYFYQWSNGQLGAVNKNLSSGCYIVTATDPGNGCASIRRFCLSATNRLKTTFEIVKPAKCGLPTGQVQLTTTGGYGLYSYSLSNSSSIKGLTKGFATCIVTDDISTCKDTVQFFVPDAIPEAEVAVKVSNVQCPGGNDGAVYAQLTAGANFSGAAQFKLYNANNDSVGLSGLAAGFYTLYIFDEDKCALPTYSFFVQAPAPFTLNSNILPETCAAGGQINLTLSGTGNHGLYYADWDDLPGQQNGLHRKNLDAGLYSATVYDSLLCAIPLQPVLVPTLCSQPDTLHRSIAVGQTDTFCLRLPVGLNPAAVTFSLQGGGTSGASTHGQWLLQPNGCLRYQAFNKTGYAVDTICVLSQSGTAGLDRPTCFIISISAGPIQRDEVYFSVQTNSSATACGFLPPNFNNPKVNLQDHSGLSGLVGNYGAYTVNGSTACLLFQAAQLPGTDVAKICVQAYDLALQQAYVVCYIPSVLLKVDCGPYQYFGDTITLATTTCMLPTSACLPAPYNNLASYTLSDNGVLYSGGLAGCNFVQMSGYPLSQLPADGPFALNSWIINNKVHSGNFPTLDYLPTLLNQIDSSGHWKSEGGLLLGGNPAQTYGPMTITTPQGIKVLSLGAQSVAQSTELQLSTGSHAVIFRHTATGCADTAFVKILCFECPPVVDYPVNSAGKVVWTTKDCDQDTVFCTKILGTDLSNYTVLINGSVPAEFLACGAYVGVRLDTGLYAIYIRNNLSTCEYFSTFQFRCDKVLVNTNAFALVNAGQQTVVCLDTTLLSPPIATVLNLCPASSNGNASWSLDLGSKCVTLTGVSAGQDTLCLQMCNTSGDCVLTTLAVKVLSVQDSLLARSDAGAGIRDKPIEVDILKNDTYKAPIQVSLLTQPLFGTAAFDPGTGLLTYTPDPGKCGTDSLRYQITDTKGRSSTAVVRITISCDELLIFNGISPNGDGANDSWTIAGIEQFPDNEVRIFNRWGNLVFERKGYTNADPWDGRWNGHDLPDGAYFYVLDLGVGGEKRSGYIQVFR